MLLFFLCHAWPWFSFLKTGLLRSTHFDINGSDSHMLVFFVHYVFSFQCKLSILLCLSSLSIMHFLSNYCICMKSHLYSNFKAHSFILDHQIAFYNSISVFLLATWYQRLVLNIFCWYVSTSHNLSSNQVADISVMVLLATPNLASIWCCQKKFANYSDNSA